MVNREHPLYGTWKHIRNRCTNPRNKDFKYYGARGIELYPEWAVSRKGRGSGSGFRAFAAWIEENLGPRPDDHTLDRVDVNGNYEPGNLRWADDQTQSLNRRPGWRMPDRDETGKFLPLAGTFLRTF